ncbi:MAG: hypothetical protein Q8P18_26295 [Pseudomonadota bacterium]|nr:hypothetical protein [Pseudomonadota bacterium]
MLLYAPVAVGDVLDRLTILALKLDRLPPERRPVVRDEHTALGDAWRGAGLPEPTGVPEYAALAEVNAALWDVEDRLRSAEARLEFGPAFVADARAVYVTNDRRAALKRTVNLRFGSRLVEEKLHPPY